MWMMGDILTTWGYPPLLTTPTSQIIKQGKWCWSRYHLLPPSYLSCPPTRMISIRQLYHPDYHPCYHHYKPHRARYICCQRGKFNQKVWDRWWDGEMLGWCDGGKVSKMCPNLVKRKLIRLRREINFVQHTSTTSPPAAGGEILK